MYFVNRAATRIVADVPARHACIANGSLLRFGFGRIECMGTSDARPVWVVFVLPGLILVQLLSVLIFAGICYGHWDEFRRWSDASFSELYSLRIAVELVGVVGSGVLCSLGVAQIVLATKRLSQSCGPGLFLRCLPFVFLAAFPFGLIGWLCVPAAGSPHNDMTRGLGFFVLMCMAIPAAAVSALQNGILTLKSKASHLPDSRPG